MKNTTSDQAIIDAITKAVALHRETRARLESRMDALLNPVTGPLKVAGHTITYRKVYGRCSQWSNRDWDVTGCSKSYVIDDTHTLGPVDVSFFDGHNQQFHRGETYADRDCSRKLSVAPAALLREIARELPDALMAYAEAHTAAAAENERLTASL